MTKLICLCNKISENEISKLLRKSPLATFSDVARATGASTSCGRCRGELESLITSLKEQSSDNSDSNSAFQTIIPFD